MGDLASRSHAPASVRNGQITFLTVAGDLLYDFWETLLSFNILLNDKIRFNICSTVSLEALGAVCTCDLARCAIVILAYVINSWQSMHRDICLWFAAVCLRRSRQLNTLHDINRKAQNRTCTQPFTFPHNNTLEYEALPVVVRCFVFKLLKGVARFNLIFCGYSIYPVDTSHDTCLSKHKIVSRVKWILHSNLG